MIIDVPCPVCGTLDWQHINAEYIRQNVPPPMWECPYGCGDWAGHPPELCHVARIVDTPGGWLADPDAPA
jgi:hypothetical protein